MVSQQVAHWSLDYPCKVTMFVSSDQKCRHKLSSGIPPGQPGRERRDGFWHSGRPAFLSHLPLSWAL